MTVEVVRDESQHKNTWQESTKQWNLCHNRTKQINEQNIAVNMQGSSIHSKYAYIKFPRCCSATMSSKLYYTPTPTPTKTSWHYSKNKRLEIKQGPQQKQPPMPKLYFSKSFVKEFRQVLLMLLPNKRWIPSPMVTRTKGSGKVR